MTQTGSVRQTFIGRYFIETLCEEDGGRPSWYWVRVFKDRRFDYSSEFPRMDDDNLDVAGGEADAYHDSCEAVYRALEKKRIGWPGQRSRKRTTKGETTMQITIGSQKTKVTNSVATLKIDGGLTVRGNQRSLTASGPDETGETLVLPREVGVSIDADGCFVWQPGRLWIDAGGVLGVVAKVAARGDAPFLATIRGSRLTSERGHRVRYKILKPARPEPFAELFSPAGA